ncbi:MAG TPA: ABC transporter substrate-binding protein [Candidatus Lustribacter sp.]
MNRAQFAALTGSAAAARAIPARAATSSSIRAATGTVEEFALPFYAVQKGFFRDAGLNVELSFLHGGGLITQAILGGAIDFGVTNSGSLSSAHVRGLPIYLLSPGGLYSTNAPIAHFIVAKTSSINDAPALNGKTIGVTTLNDMVQAAAMAWIDKHGGDAHSAKFFELTSTEMAPAIAGGRLDAAVIVEPQYTGIKDQVKLIGLPYESVNNGKPFQTTGAIGNKVWVDRNPALARRVTQVMFHTAEWANKNPAEEAVLIAQLTKIEAAKIAAIPRIAYATKSDPNLVQPVIDVMARYGFIPRSFSAAELRAPGA